MNATFNDVPLENVGDLKSTTESSGLTRTSFRVLKTTLPRLEKILQLKASARLVIGSQTIEGRIVHYFADIYRGYQVTIESAPSRP
jgi:hypothetical protein